MKAILKFTLITFIVTSLLNCSGGSDTSGEVVPIPDYIEPNSYICFEAPGEVIIDGQISSDEWDAVPWSELFRDIEGDAKPDPTYKTRMKMMWDEKFLYIAAELEEPHVWAKLKLRDTVIFYDNDFEVFIDPDDDTHTYYELEVNAFETEWDLMLLQPYRDGGPAVDSWDIQGLEVGVDVQGTINDPSDSDKGWTVEIAIPFACLEECAPGGERPKKGDQWRINFSRVEWTVEVKDGSYEKTINPGTGKHYPENNWVWSPQGFINMHMPEYWGYVQFAGPVSEIGNTNLSKHHETEARWILRNLYYRQFKYQEENGEYARSLEDLSWPVEKLVGEGHKVELEAGKYGYQAYLKSGDSNRKMVINEKGRIIEK